MGSRFGHGKGCCRLHSLVANSERAENIRNPEMPRTIYCWRCQTERPMLTEEEWALVSPHLTNMIEEIQAYRQLHNCSLAEAMQMGSGREALKIFEQITGFKESNPNALFHHRLSLYGPPCHSCGKPLRSPQARFCAMCSAPRQTTVMI